MNCDLSIVVISDIHVGHRKTPTERTIEALYEAVPDTPESASIDAVFIPGDVFDRLLDLPNDQVYQIHRWIAYLLRVCKKRDIVLRVLEGTPSHDWRQSRLFDSINEDGDINADAKHVDVLSIEWVEKIGSHILYLPDEWRADTEQIWSEVEQCLRDHGLEKVDFVLMHGQFDHQLPDHVEAPTHDVDRYSSIARHWVFCGHVHIPSRYENVLVPGSFDRLAHNEEHPKGHWHLKVHLDGDDEITFHPNHRATQYITVDCSGMSVDEALSHVSEALYDIEPGAHVRFRCQRTDEASEALTTLKKRYPALNWTSDYGSRKTDKPVGLGDQQVIYHAQPLTRETIPQLIDQRLDERQLTSDKKQQLMTLLDEVL